MGSRIPALVRSIVRAAGDFWRVGAVVALIFVLFVLLGSKVIAKLVCARWVTALIGVAIVIPLVLFAFRPVSQKTPIGEDRAAAFATAGRGIEQAAQSEDDAKEAASISEWRKAVEEVLKEADAGKRAVAGGNAEQRDTLAGAANTPQAQEPEPIDQQVKALETGAAKADSPIANDRVSSNTSASAPVLEAPQMNGPKEPSGAPLVKAEATPSEERGEMGRRRVWSGRHYGRGWYYRIHTTGVARMGPVLVFR